MTNRSFKIRHRYLVSCKCLSAVWSKTHWTTIVGTSCLLAGNPRPLEHRPGIREQSLNKNTEIHQSSWKETGEFEEPTFESVFHQSIESMHPRDWEPKETGSQRQTICLWDARVGIKKHNTAQKTANFSEHHQTSRRIHRAFARLPRKRMNSGRIRRLIFLMIKYATYELFIIIRT